MLVLEQTLKAAPRRIAGLLAAAFGEIKVLGDLIKIDVPIPDDRFVGLFVLKLFFRLLAHAGSSVRQES